MNALLDVRWFDQLTTPLFTVPFVKAGGQPVGISWRDLILIAGGIFLVFKSTPEIHHKLEKAKPQKAAKAAPAVFSAVIV